MYLGNISKFNDNILFFLVSTRQQYLQTNDGSPFSTQAFQKMCYYSFLEIICHFRTKSPKSYRMQSRRDSKRYGEII